MSVSALQFGNSWQEIKMPINVSIGDEVFPQMLGLNELEQSEEFVGSREFHGSLVIQPGWTLKQNFKVTFTRDYVTFEDFPGPPWPRFSVKFVKDRLSGRLMVNEVFLWPSDYTVKGRLLYTRLLFLINQAGGFSIHSDDIDKSLGLELPSLSATEEIYLLYSANVYRKLKYIENFFGKRFLLPTEISGEQVDQVEKIFRGITEGEFVTRDAEILLKGVLLSDLKLTVPPFSEPRDFLLRLGNKIELFDQVLDVGPIVVNLKNAEIADSRVIDKARENNNQPIDIRFLLYDPRIFYRFSRFAKQSPKIRAQRLERFKKKLALEEPRGLVDLIDKTLQNDVSSDEALHIAVGWTQYKDLPDRYCPQEPELDSDSEHWQVPIYLIYATGEGGPVGEVIIDVKTGEIVSHTPVEEIRSKGLALAEQILHA